MFNFFKKKYEVVVIDLSGLKDEEELLIKIGRVFEFGGPETNEESVFVGSSNIEKEGWGVNWNALNDSLMYIGTGGIWGVSKKFTFPLKVIFKNSNELKMNDKESFKTLKEIFEEAAEKHRLRGDKMVVEFK